MSSKLPRKQGEWRRPTAPADRAPHFREDAADSANEAPSPLSDSTQQKNSPFPFLLPKSGRDRNLLSLPIANGAAAAVPVSTEQAIFWRALGWL